MANYLTANMEGEGFMIDTAANHQGDVLGATAQPCSQFFQVANCGIAIKNSLWSQTAFSPLTTIVKEMFVKLLAGHLELQKNSLSNMIFFVHGGFIFVNLSSSQEKLF